MIHSMTMKIAVSLPNELVEHARREVREGRARSVSAYVADAIAERSERESLEDLLDEMLAASGGPMTDAERARADERLYG